MQVFRGHINRTIKSVFMRVMLGIFFSEENLRIQCLLTYRVGDTVCLTVYRKKFSGGRYFFGKVTVESVTDATDSRKSVQQLQHNRGSDEVLNQRA